MKGMIALVSEELPDVPFYFVQDRLCSLMKLPVGKSTVFRSALLNAGYRVSLSHANRYELSTLQKKEVCAQRNVPAKRFKICYILCIRKPI